MFITGQTTPNTSVSRIILPESTRDSALTGVETQVLGGQQGLVGEGSAVRGPRHPGR